MQIYLQKCWGCSRDKLLVKSIHTEQVSTMKELKYPKLLGSVRIFRYWRMDEGTSLQPEARHLGRWDSRCNLSLSLFSALGSHCWLLLRSPHSTQIPTNSHCKGNWSIQTSADYAQGGQVPKSALSCLNVRQVHPFLMFWPLSVSRAWPSCLYLQWGHMLVLNDCDVSFKLGKNLFIQKETA